MRRIAKPKIGLVAFMAKPWPGDKEKKYRESIQVLKLLSESLKFDLFACPEGIYNTEQASRAVDQMKKYKVDFVLIQSTSFAGGNLIYPFTEMDTLLGLWSIPEGQPVEGGNLPFNSFTGMNINNSIIKTFLKGYNKPIKWFLGDPRDKLFVDRFTITVRSLTALVNLHGSTIGLIGGVAPTFDNLFFNESKLKQKLNLRVQHLELDEVFRKASKIDPIRTAQISAEFRKPNVRIAPNSENFLMNSASTAASIIDIIEENDLTAVAVSCWPKFQTNGNLAVCSSIGYLNSLGIVTACEGDLISAISMFALHCMADAAPVTLMDLVTIDPSDDSLLLWHCGPTPFSMAARNTNVTLEPLNLFDGPNGEHIGLRNDLTLVPGSATVFGLTVDLNRALIFDGLIDNTKPSYKGSRGWMHNINLVGEPTKVEDLIQTLMFTGYQHHYPLALGNSFETCMEFCAWAGIEPIKKIKYTNYLS